MKNIVITAKIWKWPGDMGWHFITIPRDYYETIRNEHPKGMVHIIATIGDLSWNTALFPHMKSKSFILPIKKSIRKEMNIWEGESISIMINDDIKKHRI
jgi:hypothetical protein